MGSYLCSTPYGIRGFGIVRLQVFGSFGGSVLNALRHQRFWHDSELEYKLVLKLCSTPYGIRGFGIAGALLRARIQPWSAQRLTASEVLAFGGLAELRQPNLRCSTPYGIRGFGIQFASTELTLGAQCSTPYGIRGFGISKNVSSLTSPSVLNALRHQRFWHKSSKPPTPKQSLCSTPYGIRGFGIRAF